MFISEKPTTWEYVLRRLDYLGTLRRQCSSVSQLEKIRSTVYQATAIEVQSQVNNQGQCILILTLKL